MVPIGYNGVNLREPGATGEAVVFGDRGIKFAA